MLINAPTVEILSFLAPEEITAPENQEGRRQENELQMHTMVMEKKILILLLDRKSVV